MENRCFHEVLGELRARSGRDQAELLAPWRRARAGRGGARSTWASRGRRRCRPCFGRSRGSTRSAWPARQLRTARMQGQGQSVGRDRQLRRGGEGKAARECRSARSRRGHARSGGEVTRDAGEVTRDRARSHLRVPGDGGVEAARPLVRLLRHRARLARDRGRSCEAVDGEIGGDGGELAARSCEIAPRRQSACRRPSS